MRIALLILALPLSAQTDPKCTDTNGKAVACSAITSTNSQLPQSAIFTAAGYGTKIDASLGYAQLISQASGIYSLSYFRYVPQRGVKPSIPAVTTGAAIHLRDFGWVRSFALGQGGVATSGTATLFSGAVGGFVTIDPPAWKHVGVLAGVDMIKTAGGASVPNFDLGIVWRP